LREENVNVIVKAVKSYKENKNLEELLKIIVGYSGLGFQREVKKHIEEFLEKGGSKGDLIAISKELPEEIRNIVYPGELEIDGEFDADSFLEMGELLWEIGSPEEAKDNYIKAFEYYSLLGNKETAQRVLKTLKENYPTDVNVNTLVLEDTKDEIIPKLKAFVAKPPEYEVDLRYALGKGFHGENLFSEAEVNYRRILELDGSHNSKRLLVALLREKGSFGESLELARELGEEEKLEELYSTFESLRDSGKSKIGENVLKEIYEINPDFKDIKQLLGMVSVEEKEGKAEKVSVEISPEEEKRVKAGDEDRKDEGFEKKKIVFL